MFRKGLQDRPAHLLEGLADRFRLLGNGLQGLAPGATHPKRHVVPDARQLDQAIQVLLLRDEALGFRPAFFTRDATLQPLPQPERLARPSGGLFPHLRHPLPRALEGAFFVREGFCAGRRLAAQFWQLRLDLDTGLKRLAEARRFFRIDGVGGRGFQGRRRGQVHRILRLGMHAGQLAQRLDDLLFNTIVEGLQGGLGLQALLEVNLRLATIDHLSNGYDGL